MTFCWQCGKKLEKNFTTQELICRLVQVGAQQVKVHIVCEPNARRVAGEIREPMAPSGEGIDRGGGNYWTPPCGGDQ